MAPYFAKMWEHADVWNILEPKKIWVWNSSYVHNRKQKYKQKLLEFSNSVIKLKIL